MDLKPFDSLEAEQYKDEILQRWGDTKEYRESEQRSAKKDGVQQQKDAEDLMAVFRKLGSMKDRPAASANVQACIAELQDVISDRYYTCTKEILRGLGEMYAEDERFRCNIDAAGGEGTAIFARDAIFIYTDGYIPGAQR